MQHVKIFNSIALCSRIERVKIQVRRACLPSRVQRIILIINPLNTVDPYPLTTITNQEACLRFSRKSEAHLKKYFSGTTCIIVLPVRYLELYNSAIPI